MIGPGEAAAAKWLLDQLKSHGVANARSTLAGWVKGDPFENALQHASWRAIEAAVRHILPEPTDRAVQHTALVLDQVWPTVDVSSLSVDSGWLVRVHAFTQAAMEACQQPIWGGCHDAASSWDVIVRDHGLAVTSDEFADLLTATFVQAVQTDSIRPGSALSGLAQILAHEVAEHRDTDRFNALTSRLDSQSSELGAAVRDALIAEFSSVGPAEAQLQRIRQLVRDGVLLHDAGVQLQVRIYEELMWTR